MARREEAGLDRDLADLPADLRWREWMCRIEAVMFASASPVAREDLARVVGTGVSVDLLIDDLAVDMVGRPYEVAQVGAGWMLRTKPAYAPAIRAAADVGEQALNLSEYDLAVLAAIAFHHPVSRDGLAERDLIGTGPREPRRGAPYTFVTTETFLATFGMASLRDLPDPEQLVDAGLAGPSEAYDI
jgi:chromosome segregation and condensation protein ScpB